MTVIAAHRGASARLPDNSMAAFRAAIEAGADAIEADLRRTREGLLVLEHDPLPDAPPPLAELSQLVELARGRVRLDIELKEAGYEREVLAALDPRPEGLLLTSFLPEAVAALRELDAAAELGLLIAPEHGGDDLWARADACGADLLAPHVTLLDDDLRQTALERDRPMLVWTVNDPGSITVLLRDPAVGWLVTDEPALAQHLRSA